MNNDICVPPDKIQAKREAARRRKRNQRARARVTNRTEIQETTSYYLKQEKSKVAKAILSDSWGITRSQILDTLYSWGVRAAIRLKIPTNEFFWMNGPLKALETARPQELEGIEIPERLSIADSENVIGGEITYKREIYAEYVFCEQWRPDAIKTFDEYVAERHECKVGGTINRGNKYFGKDFHEKPHARWDEMYIQWNPNGLKPGYTQDDMKKWLAALSPDKKRLLIACRSAYKSTFSLVYLVGGVLCCPDLRVLLVTETKVLALEFLQSFVRMFEIVNPEEPTRLNRLFPEYCVSSNETNSVKFQSPMRILGLPQPTAKTTSMESGGWAGNRFDYALCSDCISSATVGTDEQIKKSVNNIDAISELREVGGYMHFEGTPWHENDLYAQLLERNQRADGKNMLYIIDPAWTVRPSGEGKGLLDLEEEDAELLFPARLTWEVLQGKIRDDDPPYRKFRMQSLCQFLPLVEETQRLHFRRDDMTRNSIRNENVPIGGRIVASSDLSFSKSRYADLTCFTILKVIEGRVYVLEQKSGLWNDTEKATEIVTIYLRYPGLDTWLIENYPNHENLENAIRRTGMLHNAIVPVRWAPFDNRKDAKFHRLKSIESVIGQNRIKFVFGRPGVSPSWMDDLFNELESLDQTTPQRKSSSKKDDRGDSLSLGIRYFLPADEDEESAATREKAEEEQMEIDRRNRQYQAIFGTAPGQDYAPPQSPYREPEPSSPIHRALGSNFTKKPQTFLNFSSSPKPRGR